MNPVRIKVKQNVDISIVWDDGARSVISLEKLRKLCPCASCITSREKMGKNYLPIYNENQKRIASVNQIGSYAIQVAWEDGHNQGIYEYPFLKNLAEDK